MRFQRSVLGWELLRESNASNGDYYVARCQHTIFVKVINGIGQLRNTIFNAFGAPPVITVLEFHKPDSFFLHQCAIAAARVIGSK